MSQHLPDLSRRSLLLGMPALALASGMRSAFAHAPTDRRLVVVLLRGAMDGLAVVPPYDDPQLAQWRGELLLPAPGQPNGLLDLGGRFGLHPALAGLHQMYGDGDLLLWHAAAGPYRVRSHFDAQDMMESGALQRLDSGWLNRVAGALPAPATESARPLVAGDSMPLLMEGKVPVASWAPDNMAAKIPSTLWQQVIALSDQDKQIGMAMREGMATRGFAEGIVDQSASAGGGLAQFAGPAGQLLAASTGPRIAALEIGGWDTHQAQKAHLASALAQLDAGLVALKQGLGAAWSKTAILVITEFGRTVRVNGTAGTDHGTASVAMLAGGAVAGGRVAGTWPGLAQGQLFENRDLAPTTDLWALAKGLLRDHVGVPDGAMAQIFPASNAQPQTGLIRKA